jgi:hypothetical protein
MGIRGTVDGSRRFAEGADADDEFKCCEPNLEAM